ncbi:MAG: acyl-CoA thioesterase [Candidatus Marinimicrobia bacterium]|jgi:acyl-CoA thioester hydrolase|nr:acyl-CoA thioesterase [Candidatus Neomarinimicrobiota bacterium]MBT3618287.1 acyl-CoA thioesterase [Candidatus Neomarinimicrobiota bacterium]MBT3828232.1 acyl-CoA thioesterase [Candidatus Neomarinimicrobiota bacterium]MBT3997149.1 acyl-CoA thioesterase [Candidatus Neomarinimicrobiota bacterium]MBT4280615.1 acyl-CoA thioesterase [Candidatus Neomarinimicrobiota bacterium]
MKNSNYNALTRSDFDHIIKMNSRWRDMDAIGHLNHAIYLTYMESARTDFYVSMGFSSVRKEQDKSIILGGMDIVYLDQCEHPVELNICHRVNRVGNKSFDLLGAVFSKTKDHPLCVGLFRMVSFNYNNNHSIPVPKEVIAHLHQF